MQCNNQLYRNIDGAGIGMDITVHKPGICVEVTLTAPKFSFLKWILTSAGLFLFGISVNLHEVNAIYCFVLSCLVLISLLLKVHFKITKESLLVISSVGVQVTQTYASRRRLSCFYPSSQIKDVIINEAITMHRIIFYMCLLLHRSTEDSATEDNTEDSATKDSNVQLLPLFLSASPPLICLQKAYREIQSVLSPPPNT